MKDVCRGETSRYSPELTLSSSSPSFSSSDYQWKYLLRSCDADSSVPNRTFGEIRPIHSTRICSTNVDLTCATIVCRKGKRTMLQMCINAAWDPSNWSVLSSNWLDTCLNRLAHREFVEKTIVRRGKGVSFSSTYHCWSGPTRRHRFDFCLTDWMWLLDRSFSVSFFGKKTLRGDFGGQFPLSSTRSIYHSIKPKARERERERVHPTHWRWFC